MCRAWNSRTWKWRTNLQDMKLQDMKLQDMKMPDMKMQDINMTDKKVRQSRRKSTVLTEITLQWSVQFLNPQHCNTLCIRDYFFKNLALSNDETQRSSLYSRASNQCRLGLGPNYCSSEPIALIFDIFCIGVVTGYREEMLNLFSLFGLRRLAHLSQFHIVLFYVLWFHVLLFHVLHFHVLSFGPSFSRLAISCLAHWSFNFMSCYFMPRIPQIGPSISRPSFSRPAFSAPPLNQTSWGQLASSQNWMWINTASCIRTNMPKLCDL